MINILGFSYVLGKSRTAFEMRAQLKMVQSNLSRTPPCPGIVEAKSLTSYALLTALAAKPEKGPSTLTYAGRANQESRWGVLSGRRNDRA